MSAAYIQVQFRLGFFMGSNNMKPDQFTPNIKQYMNPDNTAPIGAVLSGFILFAI